MKGITTLLEYVTSIAFCRKAVHSSGRCLGATAPGYEILSEMSGFGAVWVCVPRMLSSRDKVNAQAMESRHNRIGNI